MHPGYGFLAENAEFAAAVIEAGLIWVGPTPAQIAVARRQARRQTRRRRRRRAHCRRRRGETGRTTTSARRVPVLVKAAAGGGGRGMRVVRRRDGAGGRRGGSEPRGRSPRSATAPSSSSRSSSWRVTSRCRSSETSTGTWSTSASGSARSNGATRRSSRRRHRRASTQRRATALHDGALALAKHVGYENAGTVEFLVGDDGTIQFLEVNTRLQVEHPVTEAVTGIDLVELQLRVAAGEPLPMTQDAIDDPRPRHRGSARGRGPGRRLAARPSDRSTGSRCRTTVRVDACDSPPATSCQPTTTRCSPR